MHKIAQQFIPAFASLYAGIGVQSFERKVEDTTQAGLTLELILDMRAAAGKDTGAYLSAVADTFGNGAPAKAKDYNPGGLRAAIAAELATIADEDTRDAAMDALKFRLGQARKVAQFVADPIRWEQAQQPGASLAALYKAAKGTPEPRAPRATKGNVSADAEEASDAHSMTALEAVRTFGPRAVLEALCVELKARKDALHASTCEALAKQVSA